MYYISCITFRLFSGKWLLLTIKECQPIWVSFVRCLVFLMLHFDIFKFKERLTSLSVNNTLTLCLVVNHSLVLFVTFLVLFVTWWLFAERIRVVDVLDDTHHVGHRLVVVIVMLTSLLALLKYQLLLKHYTCEKGVMASPCCLQHILSQVSRRCWSLGSLPFQGRVEIWGLNRRIKHVRNEVLWCPVFVKGFQLFGLISFRERERRLLIVLNTLKKKRFSASQGFDAFWLLWTEQ